MDRIEARKNLDVRQTRPILLSIQSIQSISSIPVHFVRIFPPSNISLDACVTGTYNHYALHRWKSGARRCAKRDW